ncbi:DotU family type IV/VI secretion system protein [Oceanibaculum sp.]|uniref:DotU family type IV/VI secretion system protein n=1 Tax=Oceanibaculum sp. TaxID=1903597 RepID=UPI002586A8F4|nr:DotU family type IV/VI secretion system protein [Oceanibaculum sp.]MCH2395754.1 DotU family type IV/VI secretion system protein [Oceanibaculum sp.]
MSAADTFLLQGFRGYYDALEGWRVKALATASPAKRPEIQADLAARLDALSVEARHRGGERLGEAQDRAAYPMVALADEIFVYLDWPEGDEGGSDWLGHLFEQRYCRSHVAGEEVFARIDALERQGESGLSTGLARLFLQVLGLGFEGRYRCQPDGAAALRRYRHLLARLAFAGRPSLSSPNGRLTPEAYQHTLDPPPPAPPVGPLRWAGRLLLTLAGLAALSALVWLLAVWPLLHALALLPG